MKIELDQLYHFLDIVIMEAEIADSFSVNNILHEKHIKTDTDEERKFFFEVCDQVKSLGEKLRYFYPVGNELSWFDLTEKGIDAQKAGGHFKFVEKKNSEFKINDPKILIENYVGGNNFGIQSKDGTFNDVSFSKEKKQKNSAIEIVSWIVGIAVGLVIIYQFFKSE